MLGPRPPAGPARDREPPLPPAALPLPCTPRPPLRGCLELMVAPGPPRYLASSRKSQPSISPRNHGMSAGTGANLGFAPSAVDELRSAPYSTPIWVGVGVTRAGIGSRWRSF